jgi:uncharacterized membrane protein YfcA
MSNLRHTVANLSVDGKRALMTAVLFAFALILGYTVAVSLLLATIFGITSRAPEFVAKDHRIRKRYKLAEELAWLVCATAGAYVAAAVDETIAPWMLGLFLATIMIVVFWTNTWEMRQRGITHQMLMSLASVAGVSAGFALRLK